MSKWKPVIKKVVANPSGAVLARSIPKRDGKA